jgi:hypothetical protein
MTYARQLTNEERNDEIKDNIKRCFREYFYNGLPNGLPWIPETEMEIEWFEEFCKEAGYPDLPEDLRNPEKVLSYCKEKASRKKVVT